MSGGEDCRKFRNGKLLPPEASPPLSPAADTTNVKVDGILGQGPGDVGTRRLVLFDGACRLCLGFISSVVARDQEDIFRFAPLQSPLGQDVLRAQCLPPDLDSVCLYRDGVAYTHSEAALEICGELHGTAMKGLCIFKLLPVSLRDVGYYLVAQSRYSVFGHATLAGADEGLKARLVDTWEPQPDEHGRICGS